MSNKSRRQSYSLNATVSMETVLNDQSSFSMDIDNDIEGDVTYVNFKHSIKICNIVDIFELCELCCHEKAILREPFDRAFKDWPE